jgi:hypothetical protein
MPIPKAIDMLTRAIFAIQILIAGFSFSQLLSALLPIFREKALWIRQNLNFFEPSRRGDRPERLVALAGLHAF